jgi:hypothetical protein
VYPGQDILVRLVGAPRQERRAWKIERCAQDAGRMHLG